MNDAPQTAEVPVDELTSTGDLAELVERRQRFAYLTRRKRLLQAAVKKVDRELAKLEEKILEDYAELGTDSMRANVRGERFTIHLTPDIYGRPLKTGENDKGEESSTEADWQVACDALRLLGIGHMVGERFNAMSFGSWVREFREEHGPNWRDNLPDEVLDALDIGERMRVRCRKA